MGRVPRELWIALALLATFWVLAGLSFKPGREPTASRYQLPGVIFVLMIAAELLRGVRVPRGGIIGAYVVGAAIVAGNLNQTARRLPLLPERKRPAQGRPRGRRDRRATRSPPRCCSTEDNAGTTQSYVISSVYLADADKYGSPADSAAEIATAPEPARVAADKVLGGPWG